MTTRNAKIKQALDRANGGLSTRDLAGLLTEDDSPELLGAVELLCVLSPSFRTVDGTWRTTTRAGKEVAVLTAFEAYVTATAKRIFRSDSAMAGLAEELLPTEEELVQIVGSTDGRFELLPNHMIKYHK